MQNHCIIFLSENIHLRLGTRLTKLCMSRIQFIIIYKVKLKFRGIHRMPYDINKTPVGFAFVLLGQQIGGFSACMCSTLTIAVLVTLNFYVIAGISDLHGSINRLDQLLIRDGPCKMKVKTIDDHLIETLKFHRWIIR